MTPLLKALLALLVIALTLSASASMSLAQAPDTEPNASIRVPYGLSEGVPVQQVYVHLVNPPTDPVALRKLQDEVVRSFGVWAGDPFSFIAADGGIDRMRQRPWVASAEYRLYQATQPGEVVVALIVSVREPAPPTPSPLPATTPAPAATPTPDASPTPSPSPKAPRGLLRDGKGFPVLSEDDSSKVTLILNGALGAFSDGDPWFGSANKFVAPPYVPQNRVTWTEEHLEGGLGGITRLGTSSTWLYGAGTYLVNNTFTADTFNPRARLHGGIEKLYGGLLVAQSDSPLSVNVSGGRQPFQLNRNYLFGYVRGSANALERGGTYLSSRIAYEETILARVRLGPVSLQGFYLNPDELPAGNTHTRYLGANLNYNDNKNVDASVAFVTAPDSTFRYVLPGGRTESRAGMWLVNPRLRLTDPLGVKGLWFETEYVHQGNRNFPMSAYATYGWIGYNSPDNSTRPGIGYRYAIFSGDNPSTPTYERFDPLQSGGLGTWLQGISMAKVFPNSNLCTHNLNFNVRPRPNQRLSLDWFYLYADQLNNLGGSRPLQQLTSRHLGQEIMLTSEHTISPNLFLLGVASVAMPGQALQNALGNARPWTTLNLSLFLNL